MKDCRSSLQGILRRCMPLSDAILRIIVKNLPNPIQAQKDRLAVLLPRHYLQDSLTQSALLTSVAPPIPNVGDNEESFPFPAESEMFMKRKINEAVSAISSCTPSNNVPVTVFVSKMTPVKVAELSPADRTIYQELVAKKRLAQEESEESYEPIDSDPFTQEVFMALARVYSGVLTRNTQLLVLSHHHDPQTVTDAVDSNSKDIPSSLHGSITVVPPNSTGLYIMLGPSIFPADSVPAGNIVGIIGLEDYVLKTATLSTSWACPPLRAITFQSKPMVKVAIEPISHRDLKKLELGLQNLYHFDPVVEIAVDEATGQHLMVCLGELHLEQCVQALKDKFAK